MQSPLWLPGPVWALSSATIAESVGEEGARYSARLKDVVSEMAGRSNEVLRTQ